MPPDHDREKALAALVNIKTLADHGVNGRGGPPLHDDLKALLELVYVLCRAALAAPAPAAPEPLDVDVLAEALHAGGSPGLGADCGPDKHLPEARSLAATYARILDDHATTD